MSPSISLNFEHSYAERLPEFVASVQPTAVHKPSLLQFNQSLASELGLDLEKSVSYTHLTLPTKRIV